MNCPTHIQSLIRAKKTLVIACHANDIHAKSEWHADIYMFTAPGNALSQQPYLYEEPLRHFLNEKKCEQILLVGHIHNDAIEQIMMNTSSLAPAASLVFKNNPYVRVSRKALSHDNVLRRALTQLNVIQKCQALLEFDFIRQRVENKTLSIIGVVAATTAQAAQQVFYNGIAYNHYTALN
jgi:hypothetical protein